MPMPAVRGVSDGPVSEEEERARDSSVARDARGASGEREAQRVERPQLVVPPRDALAWLAKEASCAQPKTREIEARIATMYRVVSEALAIGERTQPIDARERARGAWRDWSAEDVASEVAPWPAPWPEGSAFAVVYATLVDGGDRHDRSRAARALRAIWTSHEQRCAQPPLPDDRFLTGERVRILVKDQAGREAKIHRVCPERFFVSIDALQGAIAGPYTARELERLEHPQRGGVLSLGASPLDPGRIRDDAQRSSPPPFANGARVRHVRSGWTGVVASSRRDGSAWRVLAKDDEHGAIEAPAESFEPANDD